MDRTRAKFPLLDLQGSGNVHLSIEQRYATLMNIFKYQYFAVYKHIGRRWGWDAANEIADAVASEAVPVIAQGYKRKFGLPGEGAALVTQVLQAEFQAEGSDVDVAHESEDGAEFDVLCVFGNALQSGQFAEVRIEEGLCNQGCVGWIGAVSRTVDKDLHATRHSWMGDGAETCRFTLQRQVPVTGAVVSGNESGT